MDNLHTETRQIAARLRGARLTAEGAGLGALLWFCFRPAPAAAETA